MSEAQQLQTTDDFGHFLKGWIRNPLAIGAFAPQPAVTDRDPGRVSQPGPLAETPAGSSELRGDEDGRSA